MLRTAPILASMSMVVSMTVYLEKQATDLLPMSAATALRGGDECYTWGDPLETCDLPASSWIPGEVVTECGNGGLCQLSGAQYRCDDTGDSEMTDYVVTVDREGENYEWVYTSDHDEEGQDSKHETYEYCVKARACSGCRDSGEEDENGSPIVNCNPDEQGFNGHDEGYPNGEYCVGQ